MPGLRQSGRRARRRLAAVALAGSVTFSVALVPAGPVAAAPPPDVCVPQTQFDSGQHVDDVMAGKLTIPGFAPVEIGTGDIDWSLDPFHHPTWAMYFRELSWVEPLLTRYHQTGEARYLDRARAIYLDWLTDNPLGAPNPLPFTWADASAVANRAASLLCAQRDLPEAWLVGLLDDHAAFLTAHWDGAWNHGLMEANALHRIGCAAGNTAQMATARQRMEDSFGPNVLGPAIDGQGLTNEQAPGYASWYNHRLWTEAVNELVLCGDTVPAVLAERLPLLLNYIAQSTQPDGTTAPLGDSFAIPPALIRDTVAEYAATRGASGPVPVERFVTFDGGYVFGRSGWGQTRPFAAESFYSLRFGPYRQVHGHQDHNSLTYYARGLPLLVDSGHTGYESTTYRDFLRSPQAHNMLVQPGSRYAPLTASTMVRSSTNSTSQFYEVRSAPYGPVHHRGVLVAQGPDVVLVFDRVAAGATQQAYQQLWHLDPVMQVTDQTATRVLAEPKNGSNTRLSLIQVPLAGQTIPADSTQVVTGQTSPYQGWVSKSALDRQPAPVVSMNRIGLGAQILTVIVPARKTVQPTVTTTRGTDGWYRLTVNIGTETVKFRVSPGGWMTRA